MISRAVKAWYAESGIGALYIDPGQPLQSDVAESFEGRRRDELLSRRTPSTRRRTRGT